MYMLNIMKHSVASFFVFILLLPFVQACSGEDGRGSGDAPSATPVAGYRLEPMDLSRHILISSQVEPVTVSHIAARMSGLITELHVQEGDAVRSGDLLARLDVEEETAELRRAEAQLEYAQARYQRIRELRERDAESAAAYEEARTGKQVAQNEVDLWRTRVGLGEVRAHKNGVITTKFVESGDAVSSNERLFRLADVTTLVTRIGVAERDVVQLEPGDPVTVRIDAFSGRDFRGSIRRIFPAAEDESRLITVEVEIDQDEADVHIRPGYLARVRLTTDHRPGVLTVPSESLLASGRDETFVYIIDEKDELKRMDVETGISRRNWTEIRAGLEPGDVVVGANPTNLQEDLYVRVTRWVGERVDGMPATMDNDLSSR